MMQRNILAGLALWAGLVASAWGSATLPGAERDFLPVDEAFALTAELSGPNTVHLRWVIADGYYLYKSRIKVRSESPLVQLGEPDLPTGDSKTDEYFGTQEVYHQQVEADVPFARSGPDAGAFQAKVTYQGCADAGLCYPPTTKTFDLKLAAATAGATGIGSSSVSGSGAPPAAEQDRLAAIVATGSIGALLGVFFLAGLALTFTPCVLPMIPILSGIIAGQGAKATPTKSFVLSLVYVLAMALTYTVAGVLAGMFGQSLPAGLQEPWVLGVFAALLVVLGVWMFGFY